MATVSSTPRTNRITLASPSAGPFEVGFRLFSADGLEVYVDGVVSADFTVDATFTDGYDDAATITFGSSLPTDTVIQIDGAEVPVREDDYLNPDPGMTRKINIEMARITAVLSEVTMKVGRALRAFDEVVPAEGIEAVDLSNLAAYTAEAEAARDEVLAIEALIPRRAGPWTTATAYVFGDLVQQDGSTYFCLVAHTAGTFNDDLASLYWEIWAQKGAAGAGAGDVVAANNGTEFNASTFRSNLGLAIGTNVQAYNAFLAALAFGGNNGLMARVTASTAAARTITGTANQLTVTNGDGVAGNPTIAAVVASQAEAEAGADTTKLMTPQRVAQAIAALGADPGAGGTYGFAGKVTHSIGTRASIVLAQPADRLRISTFVTGAPSSAAFLRWRASSDGGSIWGTEQNLFSVEDDTGSNAQNFVAEIEIDLVTGAWTAFRVGDEAGPSRHTGTLSVAADTNALEFVFSSPGASLPIGYHTVYYVGTA